MSYTLTHTSGEMEKDPPIEAIDSLVGELETADAEHSDVAVTHPSGWTLSAYPDGLVTWENVEEGNAPRHLLGVARERLTRLFTTLAEGNVDVIDNEAWLPGYD